MRQSASVVQAPGAAVGLGVLGLEDELLATGGAAASAVFASWGASFGGLGLLHAITTSAESETRRRFIERGLTRPAGGRQSA